MINGPASTAIRAILCAFAIAGAGTVAIAAGEAPKDAPTQAGAPIGGQTIPLGAPGPSISVMPPVDRNAFPAEIMERMRAALVDASGSFRVRSGNAQQKND